MRTPVRQPRQREAQSKTWPAPTAGWVANQNLARPGAKNADGTPLYGAAVLDNMFPSATSVVLMRGSELYATLGIGLDPVTSIFSYVAGAQEQLFASNENAIYDITVITEPTSGIIGTEDGDYLATEGGDMIGWSSTGDLAVLESLTGGNWVVQQFATPGGIFLRGVNGADTPFVYDGTEFSDSPELTFDEEEGELDASMFSYVWAYKSRLWFIERDSLNAWYLPVDSIGGEVAKFPLGSVFSRGGSLLFGATWSNDSGAAGGLSEQCIFVTTEGEVAVYQGTDPSGDDFSKVGVYRIGKPLGNKAFFRAGGDIVVATSVGLVSVSQAASRDFAALSPLAISYPIETAWNDAVASRPGAWNCEVWPDKQMAVVALPTVNDEPPAMFISNLRTGAWCRRINWDGTCLEVFRGRLFFGSVDGKVVEANVSGLDEGKPYTGTVVPLFDSLNAPASRKVNEMIQAFGLAPVTVNVQTSMLVDFHLDLPAAPDAQAVPTGNSWGSAVWGESTWGGQQGTGPQRRWSAASGEGYWLAPAIQLTSGTLVPIDYELVSVETTYRVASPIS